ncbi:MAG: phenylalanine--tRNA ligase subunit beta [Clostridia bacterium]|nr:phenylalanine--tRNA ligase subunit beta [Clostridia bacterium]
MKVPFSWLKDYVDIQCTAQELQDKLFSCGFEVEELTYLGKDVTGVYVGEITDIQKHPDADKLQVCQIYFGEQIGTVQICTAATNVFVGAKVPAALNGATVLHGEEIIKIKNGKLRGVTSNGMMCSGEELGINDDFYPGAEVYGILILDKDTPVGIDVRSVVGLDDYIFDIAVTANRPDCQCVLGIAREVAAVLHQPLKMPAFDYTMSEVNGQEADMKVTVSAPELCPRYIGHSVTDIQIGTSPAWLRRRLALSGIRSISNIVDITNFVLLEMGQPMHSFDMDMLSGREIVVRRAKAGEKITTLDEKEFTLTGENLVICDGDKPVALAGIMGGLNSEITENTKKVFFESAKFARDNIRKTSRALGQSSDSSARFERGVDAYTTEFGMARALHLVQQLDCGKVTGVHLDCNYADTTGKTMTASVQKINALLGITVPTDTIIDILQSLEFEVTLDKDGDTMSVKVPAYREDVDGYPDLAEEVIRMYGYEHITPTFLEKASVTSGGLNDEQKQMNKFKNVLRLQGYCEAMTYSFYSPKSFDLFNLPADAPERNAVKILNPLGEDLSILRTFLAPSMLDNVVRNLRRGNENGKLFEVANVYLPEALPLTDLPKEKKTLCLGAWGDVDFFDVKGAVESIADAFSLNLTFERGQKSFLHPGITAVIKLGTKEVGYIGELDPRLCHELAIERKVYLAELNYADLARKMGSGMKYEGIPKFPAVKRDLALLADEEVSCGEITQTILRAVKAVKAVELFDVYRGGQVPAGKKSMAFSVTFQAEPTAEKPLSGEAVDGFIRKILGNLKHNLNVEMRA